MAIYPVPVLFVQGILADIPHDSAAIVAYVVLALFLAFVLIGGRNREQPPAPQAPSEPSPTGAAHPPAEHQ